MIGLYLVRMWNSEWLRKQKTQELYFASGAPPGTSCTEKMNRAAGNEQSHISLNVEAQSTRCWSCVCTNDGDVVAVEQDGIELGHTLALRSELPAYNNPAQPPTA